MTTPEGKVKNKVKQLLKQYGAYWHCPVQNGMGAPSLDFVCCANGRYVAIETKAPGKKPTPRQEQTMHDIQTAKGLCFVVSTDSELEALELYLKEIMG